MQGNDEQAAPLADESLAMARESGDEWGISSALNALGVNCWRSGRLRAGGGVVRRGPGVWPGSWEAAKRP